MSKQKTLLILGVCTSLCVLLALFLTLQTLEATPRKMETLQNKQQSLIELASLTDAGMEVEPARVVLNGLPNQVPPALLSILGESMSPSKLSSQDDEPQSLEDSWWARRAEVMAHDVSIQDLWSAIERCEDSRPPWRLVECSIMSLPLAPGRVNATLVLETLSRDQE